MGKTTKLTNQQFIERANLIHGGRYSYELFVYNGSFNKGTVICPIHGAFTITANNHLQGGGCVDCYRDSLIVPQTEILQRFKRAHGDRFSYRFLNNGIKAKVAIMCPDHGEFLQSAEKHAAGNGCPQCASERKRNIEGKYTIDQIIEQARLVHGGRYQYPDINPKNVRTKIIIFCQEHGAFHQSVGHHLAGTGCPRCGTNRSVLANTMTEDEFLNRAADIHGDRYQYQRASLP